MNQPLSRVFQGSAQISRLILLATVLLVAIFQLVSLTIPISVQVVLAIIALAVGIPHGAIDHLITIPRSSTLRFILFIFIYTLIALLAGVAIATWNKAGFEIVVLMSSLHFGFGDAAFYNESRKAQGAPQLSFPLLALYAIPAGFLPVALPLTESRTTDVLAKLNPALINWAGTYTAEIRDVTFSIAVFAICMLLLTKNYELAIDLALLAALSTLAPPLIAFSIYFGGWHAIRHTARLVPKLPSAMLKISEGKPVKALLAAVKPGLYAIVGVFLLGAIIVASGTKEISSSFLWSILVIIWALTVPHMATTSTFDLAAFKNSPRPLAQ